MAGASKFGGTENGADCSKCGGTVAVLFKTRNGTSLVSMRCGVSCSHYQKFIVGTGASVSYSASVPCSVSCGVSCSVSVHYGVSCSHYSTGWC